MLNVTPPFIYALVDPNTPKHIRYVGMTMRNAGRPHSHLVRARQGSTRLPHLMNWVRKLQSENRDPQILILESLPENTDVSFVGLVESCYIKSLREIGHKLTNIADGGECGPSDEATRVKLRSRWTPERRAVQGSIARARLLGKPAHPNALAALTASLRGRTVTDETREKFRINATGNTWSIGKKRSPESRVRSSEAMKAALAAGANRGRAVAGRKDSEETLAKRSASMKAVWARKRGQIQ